MGEAWKEPIRQLALNGQTVRAIEEWRSVTGDSLEVACRAVNGLLAHSESVPGAMVPSQTPLDAHSWKRKTQATSRFSEGKGPAESYERGQVWLGRTNESEAVGFSDDRHLVTIAGSRSGKGTSAIVPNLCNYPGSVICIDPKGENATVTARRRGSGSPYATGLGQEVAILDPFQVADVPEELRASFNPLDLIDLDGPDAIDEAKAIAEAIVVSDDPKDMHWTESARQWVAALILYVKVTAPPGINDLDMVRLLFTRGIPPDGTPGGDDDDAPSGFVELLRRMKRCDALDGAIAASAETIDGMAIEERGSVLSFARRNTAFLDSPRMKAVTRTSTFSLDSLKTSTAGLTIYLCLPVKALGNHGRWLRLMVMLAMAQMERLGHKPPACGHPVLFLLDEFASLGYMRPIEQAIGYVAGFAVKLWIVLQDLQQLQSHYKQSWSTFLANAGVLQCFANNDQLTLEYVSKRLGDTEVRQYTTTESRSSSESQSTSTSYSRTVGTSQSLSKDTSTTRAPPGLIFRGKRLSASAGSSRSNSAEASTTTGGGTDSSRGQEEGRSIAETIAIAPLLRPDEIERRFGSSSGLQIVIVAGNYPLILQRIDYFDDPEFVGKYDPHPAHPNNVPLTLEAREAIRLEDFAKAEADRAEASKSELARSQTFRSSTPSNRTHWVLAAITLIAFMYTSMTEEAKPPVVSPSSSTRVVQPRPPAASAGTARPPPVLTPATPPAVVPVPADTMLGVASIAAYLRSTPTDGGEVVAQLPRGTLVTALERSEKYVRVQTETGASGWVANQVLIGGGDVDRLQNVTASAYVASRDPNALLQRLDAQLEPLKPRVRQLRRAMRQRAPDVDALFHAVDAERSVSLPLDVSASVWFRWSTQAEQRAANSAGELDNALAGIAADPTNPEHYVAFGLAEYRQNDFDQMHKAASFLPFLAPTATNTWMLVGLSDALRDMPDDATAAFSYGITLSKNAKRTRKYFDDLARTAPDPRIAAALRKALAEE